MTPRLLLLATCFFTFSCLFAQSSALTDVYDRISEELQNVETAKYRYEQSLDYDQDRPWEITLTVSEVPLRKGDPETTTYILNLSDLDARRINYEDARDEQTVRLRTSRGQSLVLVRDEDGDEDYEDEAVLWSTEVDNATALRDLFREAVPLATELWEADFVPGTTLDALSGWLASAVRPVERDEETRNVTWAVGDHPDLVELSVTDEDDETTVSRFSLADLAKNSLKLDIGRGELAVEVATIGKKSLIQVTDPDGDFGYEDELTLPVGTLDEGRRIIQSLEAALDLARTARKDRMPQPTDTGSALRDLAALLTEVDRGDEKITTELVPETLSTLTITTAEEDGEEEVVRYLFDFGDLSAKSVGIEAKGDALSVELGTTGGKDYLQVWEDEEPDGFTDRVDLPVSDVETAQRAQALVTYIIEQTRETVVEAGDMTWLSSAVASGSDDEMSQRLETGDEACKWTLTTEELGGKNSETLIYDFNLYDLNPKDTEFSISRDRAVLNLRTLRREKIINVLEDDEPGFTEEIAIPLASLSDAKKAVATVKALIEGCAR